MDIHIALTPMSLLSRKTIICMPMKRWNLKLLYREVNIEPFPRRKPPPLIDNEKSKGFVNLSVLKKFKVQDIGILAVKLGMETVNPICTCLNNLTPEQKQKADAVAGGDFSKILIELQIIRASFGAEKSDSKKGGLPEFKRPQDILNVFFSEELQTRQAGADPYFLEKKFSFLGPSAIKTMI